ncbi:oxidoreductase [Cycloclasticus sp. 46_120_T64]|nr:oxidoreductase [Cycloclasticus sp. 46_120_T64]
MALIKDKQAQADNWQYLDEDSAEPSQTSIVSLEYWQQNKDSLAQTPSLGLRVLGHTEPAEFIGDLARFELIAIEFPAFTDGRGYSLAKTLRDKYNYHGEIRAIGDILPDQALYLTRVGFDALEFASDEICELAVEKLSAFSVFYQTAATAN